MGEPRQEKRQIDQVDAEVHENAAPGTCARCEPPAEPRDAPATVQRGVDVVDRPELPLRHQHSRRPGRRRVPADEPKLHETVRLPGGLDDRVALGGVEPHRLLEQHVPTGPQGRDREVLVKIVGHRDGDGVETIHGQQLIERPGRHRAGVLRSQRRCSIPVVITDRRDLHAGSGRRLGVHGGNAARPRNPQPQRHHRCSNSRFRRRQP